MPDTTDSADAALHVKPFVYDDTVRKALYFSISEIQSRMGLADPSALDLEYTRTMMAFLMFHPQPAQIAMIGLGGGSLAKFCHRYLPAARIQVVEINPHVIALRDEFQVPPDDDRFRVIRGDGADLVRLRATRCDVLMVDGFDVDGLPDRLCSQRFYDDAWEMLQPGGMLVANLHYGHVDHAAQVARIRRSFQEATLVVVDADCGNSIVFGCKGPALERFRPGIVRPPRGLDKAAADQLTGAFARVSTAWTEQFGTQRA
jgi:spermidine synthase